MIARCNSLNCSSSPGRNSHCPNCSHLELHGSGVDPGGRVWRWAFSPLFGPTFLRAERGEMARQPDPLTSPAWDLFQTWLDATAELRNTLPDQPPPPPCNRTINGLSCASCGWRGCTRSAILVGTLWTCPRCYSLCKGALSSPRWRNRRSSPPCTCNPNPSKTPDGLKTKYLLHKADGRPVDPQGAYFVLKLNSLHPDHRRASIDAALAYAEAIRETLPQLAQDLEKQCRAIEAGLALLNTEP